MKIVLTGSTGFVGGEVLLQCLANPRITSVVSLVRQLKQIIMKDDDFLNYPDDVKTEIAGSQGCIWSLGAPTFPNDEMMRRVSIDYNKYAATQFASLAASSGNKMQFVYVSGGLVERDQSAKLWLRSEFRKGRGLGEQALLDEADQNPSAFQATIARPMLILAKTNKLSGMLVATGLSIRVEELAATLIDCALNGSQEHTLENKELVKTGKALLQSR